MTMVTEATDEATSQPWEAVLVIEGQPSGDGRMVAPGALSWGEDRPLPLPLYFQRETPPGGLGGNPHAGALPVGVITQIERLENVPEEGLNTVVARGLYDLSLRDTAEAIQLASGPEGEGGPVRGISADLDDVDAEVDEASGTMTMLSARIMGATQCPFQALPGSRIAITDAQALEIEVEVETDAGATTVHPFVDSNGDGTCDTCELDQEGHDAAQAALKKQGTGVVRGPRVASLTADALTAALAGLPPEAWFGDPDLERLTPLTITDELANGWRRIYGHAFGWRTPHTALGNVTPPRSRNGYASFMLTAQRATCDCPDRAGMVELSVGSITLGTTHQRNLRAGAKETLDHYDHTGLQVAKVAMGEDDHGGWFAGAIPPWVEDERVEQLRGATLSGDWRWIGGHRELVALLAVNTPGFPVPRGPAVHISGGRETALVAAGIVPCDGPECEVVGEPEAGTSSDAEARLAVLESQVRGLLRSSSVVGLDAEALAVLRRRLGIVDPEEQAALVARLGLS